MQTVARTFYFCAAFVRSCIHMLWMLLTVVPWAVAVLVMSVGLRGAPLYWLAIGWLRCAMWGLKVLCGVQWRISGLQHLPTGQNSPAILLSKHQSTLETFLLPAVMPHPLAFVFKKELLYIPFFGWAMGRLDMIHIDRSQRTRAFNKVVEQGNRFLAQGIWIILFPEGTRVKRGEKGVYKTGGARLAVATGVPVNPIAVSSARCWPRKAFVKYPGVIDVSIGPPIASANRDPQALMQEVEDWIEAEMRRLDPDAYGAAAQR